ncbi:MAG: hypothetical protein HOV80_06060 [Polyangiaceae bacterium]|nr:hypothetical protein [Polyangiaceae bacterium]
MEPPLRFHLFRESLGPRVFRMIAPRVQDGLRISTNRFHHTWHVVCAPGHVRTLRRILWAAAFDNHPHTMFVLHGGTLEDTPFDAAPSRPVVIACTDHTHLRHDAIKELLRRIRRRKHPDGTVKLQVHGLARADALSDGQHKLIVREKREHRRWPELRVELIGGAIAFLGPAAALRHASMNLDFLEQPLSRGRSNHHYLDRDRNRWPEGEVQVFADYREMLSDARIERQAAYRELPDMPSHQVDELICERSYIRSLHRLERQKEARKNTLAVRSREALVSSEQAPPSASIEAAGSRR